MGSSPNPIQAPARRRSSRLTLHLTVTLSGLDAKSQTFEERTETLEVSKYGARIKILRELKVGAILKLDRPDADRSSQVRMIYQNPPDPATGGRETGIELVGVEGFWGINFPPEKGPWA